jgi:CarD family transcriptional regulator
MKQFKVGQSVVHKTHGVGVVVSIEDRSFSNINETSEVKTFLVLHIEDNGAPKKVFVPLETASERVRPVVSEMEAKRILNVLAFGKPKGGHATWNGRYREYMECIRSGDALAIAQVIVELKHLAAEKELSFGERKLLEQATSLIQAELYLVEGK